MLFAPYPIRSKVHTLICDEVDALSPGQTNVKGRAGKLGPSVAGSHNDLLSSVGTTAYCRSRGATQSLCVLVVKLLETNLHPRMAWQSANRKTVTLALC